MISELNKVMDLIENNIETKNLIFKIFKIKNVENMKNIKTVENIKNCGIMEI